MTAETTYVYAVLARNANGLSAQSDTTTASTPAAPVEPESDLAIAGADFTLDGKALDTTGTCSETDVASISDGCTINIIIKAPVFAVDGTLDSNDRLTIKTGRDKAAVDAASNIADENDLRGTDQTVVLTFPEGISLLRLWGDEDGTAGGGEEHFFQVNVELAASIEAVKSPVIEGEEEVQFRITLSDAAPSGGVDVMVELTQHAPATPGPIADADFKVHTVNIAQGQTEAILEVLTTRNAIQSNTNSVDAEIQPGTGYAVGSNSEASVTVLDRDKVNVRFADGCGQTITVAEGDGEASFDIVLDNPVAFKFTLTISIVNGDATGGNDFSGGTEALGFDRLQTRLTVTVPILEDTQIEPTEDFLVRIQRSGLDSDILTPACGDANPQLTVEITDNDTANISAGRTRRGHRGRPHQAGTRPQTQRQLPSAVRFRDHTDHHGRHRPTTGQSCHQRNTETADMWRSRTHQDQERRQYQLRSRLADSRPAGPAGRPAGDLHHRDTQVLRRASGTTHPRGGGPQPSPSRTSRTARPPGTTSLPATPS